MTEHNRSCPAVAAWAEVIAGTLVATAMVSCLPSASAAEVPSLTGVRPVVDTDRIEKWKANDSQGIWIGVAGGRWLYATFQKPCTDLPSAVAAQFRWSLSDDLRVGASVKTSSGMVCAVRHLDEVAGSGSLAAIADSTDEPDAADLAGVVVEGRAGKDVPQCGLRAVVWAMTRPGSAWRLITPVENVGTAAACLSQSPAGQYRWTEGTAP